VVIREVARLAGVSLGTVSRVINGHPTVAPDIRKRVQAAIDKLGFRPNRVARSLRSQQSHTFGLVIPDVTNPFFAELVKSLDQSASEFGYNIILGNAEESPAVEKRYIQMLADRQVDGLLVVPSVGTRTLKAERDVKIVLIDRALPNHHVVLSDHRGGAKQAVAHLIALGHSRIACIAGPQNLTVAVERWAGYREIMLQFGTSPTLLKSSWTEFANFDYSSAYEAARRLLARKPRPTALFASSDQQAIGALRAAADLGLGVPQDLSVVGFDDIPLSDLVSPRLTTVRQAVAELSRVAVDTLIRLHKGESISKLQHIATEMRIRDSSGPCPDIAHPKTSRRLHGDGGRPRGKKNSFKGARAK
jgi:LacI family transcriptional regulator